MSLISTESLLLLEVTINYSFPSHYPMLLHPFWIIPSGTMRQLKRIMLKEQPTPNDLSSS